MGRQLLLEQWMNEKFSQKHMKLITKICKNLTPNLLKPEYTRINKFNPTYGHCYIACEALYHLLGGKQSGLDVYRARDADGVVHWWLKDGVEIIDPTKDQYLSIGKRPPYDNGKKGGFLTKKPSKRAEFLLQTIQEESA